LREHFATANEKFRSWTDEMLHINHRRSHLRRPNAEAAQWRGRHDALKANVPALNGSTPKGLERYRYGVSTIATKIIQAERRSAFARIFRLILCSRTNKMIPRSEKYHSTYYFPESAHDAVQSVSLHEHSFFQSEKFLSL
jgi:hypothetical protein